MSTALVNDITKDLNVSKKIGLLDFPLAEETILKHIRAAWPNVNKALTAALIGATKKKYNGPTVTGILKVVKELKQQVDAGELEYIPRAAVLAAKPIDDNVPAKGVATTKAPKVAKPTTALKSASKRKDENLATGTQKRVKTSEKSQEEPVKVDLTEDDPAPEGTIESIDLFESEELEAESEAAESEEAESAPTPHSAAPAPGISPHLCAAFKRILSDMMKRDRLESCTMEQIEEDEQMIELGVTMPQVRDMLEDMEQQNMVMVHEDTVYAM